MDEGAGFDFQGGGEEFSGCRESELVVWFGVETVNCLCQSEIIVCTQRGLWVVIGGGETWCGRSDVVGGTRKQQLLKIGHLGCAQFAT